MIRLSTGLIRPWHAVALILATIGNGNARAQSMHPLIRATDKTVNIKDGTIFQKAIWTLSPDVKPDVYYALSPDTSHKVTFYTDIDSISFIVNPGDTYDFFILLNDTDTCYTQIRSIKPEAILVKKMSPDDLQHDFTFLKEALQREHAGLYRYISETEFILISDSLQQTLNHPMDQFEFGTMVKFYLGAIRDGHTGSSLPSELMKYYSQHVKMFPVQLHFIGHRAYVLFGGPPGLPPGTELLAIDGESVDGIRKQLFRYLSGDGRIESKKYWVLNKDGFPFLYSWAFGEKHEYTVKYKTQSSETKTINLTAQYLKEPCNAGHPKSDADKHLRLEYLPRNTAVLTVATFSSARLGQTGEDFVQFLKNSFSEINTKQIDQLIIDLRGNSGGDDKYGSLLYSYLTSKPFRYFSSIETTSRKLKVTEHPGLGEQAPAVNNFNGKVIFLINGLCFSTTSDFCAVAKSNRRGKFVGEETGGAYYGNTSGENFRTTLPNSSIHIKIPKHKYQTAVRKTKYSDRGIIPDYIVIPDIGDVISGRDVQMIFALKLI